MSMIKLNVILSLIKLLARNNVFSHILLFRNSYLELFHRKYVSEKQCENFPTLQKNFFRNTFAEIGEVFLVI